MEILVKAGGLYCILLVVFHLLFWRIFDWKTDLRSLSPVNRAIMQVLNLCLTMVFAMFAWVSLFHTGELLATSLGRSLLAFISLLWFVRAAMQAVFFGLGRRVSVAFLLFFVAGGLLYAWPVLAHS